MPDFGTGSIYIMPEVSLFITVKPKSPRNEVLRMNEGILVRVTAPPVEGAANIAVIKILAVALGLPKSHLVISAGSSGRVKRISISGITADAIQQKLSLLPKV
jgi:uncharacterized protein (TIGR00251 family)